MKYLNQQHQGDIDYCDYTWNPLGWGCEFGCEYCYARRIAKRGMSKCPQCNAFVPHFHPERLDAPTQLKDPARIFACDMSDLFGKGVEREWQECIFQTMRQTPQHTYQTLTKQGIGATDIPDNVWFGVSVHSQAMVVRAMDILHDTDANLKWVSFEPLMGNIVAPLLFDMVDWIVIGALSRGHEKVQPQAAWVNGLLQQAEDSHLPVMMKNNLEWDVLRQEFPT